jgi:hypothetical protein
VLASNPARLPVHPRTAHLCKKRAKTRPTTECGSSAASSHEQPFRYSGVSRTLAKAAVEFARAPRLPCAVEGYAMVTQPGVEITWGELHVGSRSIFADAGLRPDGRRTQQERRVVMRIERLTADSGRSARGSAASSLPL